MRLRHARHAARSPIGWMADVRRLLSLNIFHGL
jgi:hypothetical protein